jgi:hypothetical protein
VTADAKNKTYGENDPTLTYQVTTGSLASGDTTGSVFTGSLTRDTGQTVAGSPYAIKQGTLAANGNYDLTFNGANLTITARPITVSADAKSKVYGANDPALTYQLTNGTLANGESLSGILTGSLTRAEGQTVAGSPYAINKGTLAANANYNLTFNGANLTITARPITVTPDSGQSKVYGANDPALTYSLTNGTLGFNDTLAGVLTGSLTRAEGQTVAGGPYAIQQGTLAANGNYNLTFGTGVNFTSRTTDNRHSGCSEQGLRRGRSCADLQAHQRHAGLQRHPRRCTYRQPHSRRGPDGGGWTLRH